MKIYHEPWKKFAKKYLYVSAPTTPSRNDMRIIEAYLKKILKLRKPKVLILGCTVNFRKLLAKYGLSVDLLDINPIMYKVNTVVLKGIKRRERFIEGNWIKKNLRKRYDLILGDFVITNVCAKDKSRFYRNVKKHMKEDALFITRVCFRHKKIISKEQIYRQYKNKRITRKRMNELWWDAIFNLTPKNNTTENREAFIKLSNYGKYRYMKKWVDFYQKVLPTERKVWSWLKKKDQHRELKRHFRVIDVKYGRDFKYWQNSPIYVLSK